MYLNLFFFHLHHAEDDEAGETRVQLVVRKFGSILTNWTDGSGSLRADVRESTTSYNKDSWHHSVAFFLFALLIVTCNNEKTLRKGFASSQQCFFL
jgi:hypothetical protein